MHDLKKKMLTSNCPNIGLLDDTFDKSSPDSTAKTRLSPAKAMSTSLKTVGGNAPISDDFRSASVALCFRPLKKVESRVEAEVRECRPLPV